MPLFKCSSKKHTLKKPTRKLGKHWKRKGTLWKIMKTRECMHTSARFQCKMNAVTGAQTTVLTPIWDFGAFFCLQRQLFVQNPHRVTILHLPVSSIITVSVHWGICVWAHLCFHVSDSESLWLSLCQYSSFCSSVWPAPCPITESCSDLSSLSSMFSSLRCDIYFCPRSTFVVSFSLIVTRSHLLFFFSVSTHLPLSPRYYSKCVQCVFLYHVLDFPANTILKLVLKRLHFNFCPGLHKTDVEQQTVVMWLTELKGNSFLCASVL